MAERRSPLYEVHRRLSAEMVKGGGDYLFPLSYTSPVQEHVNTRTNVGMQDLTSMGEVDVKGPGSERLINYLLVNDEADETSFEIDTRTDVLDVTDLENPTLHAEHFHDTRSITHNNYVVGDLVYQSNYTSGLRVLDTTPLYDADDPRLEEVAFFDTFPAHGEPTFEGTWSNYPFFESDTIAVSGIDEGLFLLRLQPEVVDDPVVEQIYARHHKWEKYLRNTRSLATIAIVSSQQTERRYRYAEERPIIG
jgi:hypothetical protein